MSDLILKLAEIKPRHQSEFGSKATNLGLIARKSRTAEGFCLSTAAYYRAINTAGVAQDIIRLAEEAQATDLNTLTLASQQIEMLLKKLVIPENILSILQLNYGKLKGDREKLMVAVRSSASAEDLPTASFAGQLESFLNLVSFDEVIEAVIKCWVSLWSPRAIHYRYQKGIGQRHTGMAIIIQEMVDAQIAGVMFTANPLNNNRKEIYIEAVKGLGESLVQGEQSGDRYIVQKDNFFVSTRETREQEPYLVDFNIKWLANEGLRLQYLFYDEPQDIEWAYDKGEIYLLQTRPITTLGDDIPELLDTAKMTQIQKDVWVNVNERFPEPILPIDSVIAKMFYLSLFSAYDQLGYNVPVVDWASVEEGDFPDFFNPPAITTGLTRYFKLFKFLDEDIAESWKYNEQALDRYLNFLKDDEIKEFPMEIIIEYIEDALKDFQRANTFRYFLYIQYGTWYNILSKLVVFLYGEAGKEIQQDLIAGHPQATVALNEELLEIANLLKTDQNISNLILQTDTKEISRKLMDKQDQTYLKAFNNFLDKYGDREVSQGLGGIAASTWRDKPEVVWGMLKGMLLTDAASLHSNRNILQRRELAEKRLKGLTANGISRVLPLKGIFNKLFDYARKYSAFREDSHFYLTQAMPVFRAMFLQIGKQLVKRDIITDEQDVLYFTYWELKELVYDLYSLKKVSKLAVTEKLRERKQRLDKRRKQWMARGVEIDLKQEGILQGIGSSTGKVSGFCKVITDPKDLSRLKPGDILVAQSTNPSWTPVFSFIGGLIVEYGSAISHAAIVAREYGIPAVMGVPGVTKTLKDNEHVTIDGSKGVIQRLT